MGKKLEPLLDEYGALMRELRDHRAAYQAAQEALMARIPEEIRDALAHLTAEHSAALTALELRASTLATTIKRGVPALGHSVKGTSYQAVYTPGRPLWDDAMLQGCAMAHPEVLAARSVSEPSVSLRPVTPKGETL